MQSRLSQFRTGRVGGCFLGKPFSSFAGGGDLNLPEVFLQNWQAAREETKFWAFVRENSGIIQLGEDMIKSMFRIQGSLSIRKESIFNFHNSLLAVFPQAFSSGRTTQVAIQMLIRSEREQDAVFLWQTLLKNPDAQWYTVENTARRLIRWGAQRSKFELVAAVSLGFLECSEARRQPLSYRSGQDLLMLWRGTDIDQIFRVWERSKPEEVDVFFLHSVLVAMHRIGEREHCIRLLDRVPRLFQFVMQKRSAFASELVVAAYKTGGIGLVDAFYERYLGLREKSGFPGDSLLRHFSSEPISDPSVVKFLERFSKSESIVLLFQAIEQSPVKQLDQAMQSVVASSKDFAILNALLRNKPHGGQADLLRVLGEKNFAVFASSLLGGGGEGFEIFLSTSTEEQLKALELSHEERSTVDRLIGFSFARGSLSLQQMASYLCSQVFSFLTKHDDSLELGGHLLSSVFPFVKFEAVFGRETYLSSKVSTKEKVWLLQNYLRTTYDHSSVIVSRFEALLRRREISWVLLLVDPLVECLLHRFRIPKVAERVILETIGFWGNPGVLLNSCVSLVDWYRLRQQAGECDRFMEEYRSFLVRENLPLDDAALHYANGAVGEFQATEKSSFAVCLRLAREGRGVKAKEMLQKYPAPISQRLEVFYRGGLYEDFLRLAMPSLYQATEFSRLVSRGILCLAATGSIEEARRVAGKFHTASATESLLRGLFIRGNYEEAYSLVSKDKYRSFSVEFREKLLAISVALHRVDFVNEFLSAATVDEMSPSMIKYLVRFYLQQQPGKQSAAIGLLRSFISRFGFEPDFFQSIAGLVAAHLSDCEPFLRELLQRGLPLPAAAFSRLVKKSLDSENQKEFDGLFEKIIEQNVSISNQLIKSLLEGIGGESASSHLRRLLECVRRQSERITDHLRRHLIRSLLACGHDNYGICRSSVLEAQELDTGSVELLMGHLAEIPQGTVVEAASLLEDCCARGVEMTESILQSLAKVYENCGYPEEAVAISRIDSNCQIKCIEPTSSLPVENGSDGEIALCLGNTEEELVSKIRQGLFLSEHSQTVLFERFPRLRRPIFLNICRSVVLPCKKFCDWAQEQRGDFPVESSLLLARREISILESADIEDSLELLLGCPSRQ